MRASGMLNSTHHAILNLAILAVLVYPATVFSEVSDKEPSADLFWKIGLAAAIICFVGARIKPWLGIICFLPAAMWFGSLFLELHSPDVGPHLRIEQGSAYFLQAYAAFGLSLCGLFAGYVLHRKSVT
jgi:4-hydroxybenzoate polyprenyltransferase